ncbi:MAG: SMC-Scp complex subunit ScpB [Oscillospiraceae bacterium]
MLSTKEKEIFAILFASGEPIEAEKLSQAVEIDKELLNKLVRNLADNLEDKGFPLQVLTLGTKFQLATDVKYAPVIKSALDVKRNVPLSQAAMEVLAIVAYNQPVTKSFVEQIRGVDSSGIVNSLVEKSLIEEAGRLEIPGRPISYVTSSNFLRCFGISSLDELPLIDYNSQDDEEIVLEDFAK